MLTNEGQHVVEEIERGETLRITIMCYQCCLSPEYHGGLCADCLLDRKIEC